jgi:hypothetical protein
VLLGFHARPYVAFRLMGLARYSKYFLTFSGVVLSIDGLQSVLRWNAFMLGVAEQMSRSSCAPMRSSSSRYNFPGLGRLGAGQPQQSSKLISLITFPVNKDCRSLSRAAGNMEQERHNGRNEQRFSVLPRTVLFEGSHVTNTHCRLRRRGSPCCRIVGHRPWWRRKGVGCRTRSSRRWRGSGASVPWGGRTS